MAAFERRSFEIPKPAPVPGAGDGVTVFIDNYDSFSYNVVQVRRPRSPPRRVAGSPRVARLRAVRPRPRSTCKSWGRT